MTSTHKKIYIASIFTLIGVVLCQDIAYSLPDSSALRPPLATSKTAGELRDFQQQENLNPKIEIKAILNIPWANNITICEAVVDGEEYEISCIGIKRIDPDDLTSKVVDNPQKCVEIAEAVNKVDGRLGEAAQREKWAWWSPKFASGQTVKGPNDKLADALSADEIRLKAKEKLAEGLYEDAYELFGQASEMIEPDISRDIFEKRATQEALDNSI